VGRWSSYPDLYIDGSPEPTPSVAPPAGLQVPVRGFGKVWRERPAVRDALGFATGDERAYGDAQQAFEGGRLLWSGSDARLIWALYADGTYFRFLPPENWLP
jgi:hypothetical protein